MCVQTGGGSDVVVKNNPNMLKYERQKCTTKNYPSITSRWITVWADNQRENQRCRKLYAQMRLLISCLIVLAVKFFYWMLLLCITG